MMKNKLLTLLSLLLFLPLCACSLAKPDAQVVQQGDRLVGVFVTSEYLDLFDFEGYFSENAGSLTGGEITIEDTKAYEGKIISTETQDGSYDFGGVEGSLLAQITQTDSETGENYICTIVSGSLSGTASSVHAGGISTLSGEVVAFADEGDIVKFYVNPVYQTAAGEIYCVSGQGLSFNSSYGASASQFIEETNSISENGESFEEGLRVEVKLTSKPEPESFELVMLNGENEIVDTLSFLPSEIPQEINLKSAEYIILVTKSGGQNEGENSERELYTSETEILSILTKGEDGKAAFSMVELVWE